jgi:hypothetical protein
VNSSAREKLGSIMMCGSPWFESHPLRHDNFFMLRAQCLMPRFGYVVPDCSRSVFTLQLW